jgi:hypothetical protein
MPAQPTRPSGTPSYTSINVNTSPIEYDTTGTTVTGGILLGAWALNFDALLNVPLIGLDIVIGPGDTLTVTTESTSSHAPDAAFI